MTTNISSAISLLKASSYSKTSLAYKSALELLNNPKEVVKTGKSTGSGRYSSSTEWSFETILLLKSIRVYAQRKNVAPNGGRWGERVFLSEKQKAIFSIDINQVYTESGLKGVYKALKNSGIEFRKEIIEFGLHTNAQALIDKREFIDHAKLQFHYYSRGLKCRKTGYNYNVIRGIAIHIL